MHQNQNFTQCHPFVVVSSLLTRHSSCSSLQRNMGIWSWCRRDCSAAVLQWLGQSAMCAQVTMVTGHTSTSTCRIILS